MKLLRCLYIFSLALILQSCANKVAPTGGSKDILPPVLLVAEPENKQVNFTSSKIVLTFNEYVQLKDAQKQVMISPPMNPAPQIDLRKKSIVITFIDSLKANTTYTLNFGNAIADFTEGNSLAGFQYVFSTGPVADTLTVSGIIRNALTTKPVKDAVALIYDAAAADSLIGNTPPMYYARTAENGIFTIRNVREGTYRLLAVDDKNNNYTVEIGDEAVGAGKNIELKDSVFVEAFIALQPPLLQSVKSSTRELPGTIITAFERPVQNLSWKFIGIQPEKIIPEYSAYRDTVILYCFPGVVDSTQIVWIENNTEIDTTIYRPGKIKSAPSSLADKFLAATTYPVTESILLPETMPYIKWAVPYLTFDTAAVKVYKDSALVPFRGYFMDSLRLKFAFDRQWTEGKYKVIVPAGAATDIYGRSNDTVVFNFSVADENTSGSITLNFTPQTDDFKLLQLVNDKDEIVRQRQVKGAVKDVFTLIAPGEYRIRIIYDLNNNGKWDSGEVKQKIFPEKVVYYNDPVTVRSNWEVELEWKE